MKVYKFVFILGLCNILLPFIGIPSVYKQYGYLATGVFAVVYALIVRTVQKERESGLTQSSSTMSETQHTSVSQNNYHSTPQSTRKIEEVVEMEETQNAKITRIKVKRPAIKAKVVSVHSASDN